MNDQRIINPVMEAGHPPNASVVTVRGLTPAMVTALSHHLAVGNTWQSILSVRVVDDATTDDNLPAMSGHHRLLQDGIQFIPYWPFESAILYRSWFRPPRDAAFDGCPTLSLDVTPPAVTAPPARVLTVYPSEGDVPENILRFYVTFSEAMQRGHAQANVVVIGETGRPELDVLFRAPVEAWSPDMRRLTVLVDPGRLKRQVGPHRQLGPPLVTGRAYALVIDTGMIDQIGQPLAETHRHHFRVTEAVRQRVDVHQWLLRTPTAGSRQPLQLDFHRQLDWAMLPHSIRIDSIDGPPVAGRVHVGHAEMQCRFIPAVPWVAGRYHVAVAPQLEDVCGNDLMATFDRDVHRDGPPLPQRPASIPFDVF